MSPTLETEETYERSIRRYEALSLTVSKVDRRHSYEIIINSEAITIDSIIFKPVFLQDLSLLGRALFRLSYSYSHKYSNLLVGKSWGGRGTPESINCISHKRYSLYRNNCIYCVRFHLTNYYFYIQWKSLYNSCLIAVNLFTYSCIN